jgi:hypothetical protein
MKPTFLALAAVALVCACSPAGQGDNPRDREGSLGAVTWRVVSQPDGQAAFLSRPGAAPDLVLWCRDTGQITLRAHVFDKPADKPDLLLETQGGTIAFANVRRQGGLRSNDRKLVEGSVTSADGKLPAILLAAGNLKVISGVVVYQATDTDPTGILPAFTQACTGKTQKTKTDKN